jgi:hypothetical protein
VLADGVYDGSSPFTTANADRIYAQHPRGAVFKTGLVMGSNAAGGGGIVRGVAFDVSVSSKAFGGGIIHVWGPGGANTQVLDCTFDGNNVVPVGLLAYNPQGLVAQRLTFQDFTDEGIRASDNKTVSYGASTPRISKIADISVDGVSRSTPGASNGTAEAGLFIGHPVTNGVSRIKVHNVSWSGIELANNAWDTRYSDLTIDMTGSHAYVGVGVYLEHFSIKDTFTDLNFTGVRVGFNAEWNDGTAGNAAAHNVVIQNGVIDARGWTRPGHTAGVYLDEGTESTTVSNVAFRNQNWAGIGAYKNVGTNVFSSNDYSGLAAGAVTVSSGHV